MAQLYRSLLYLYPARYRREFGEEMSLVLSEARRAIKGGFSSRTRFWLKEVAGLLSGAAREHFHGFTGSNDWNSSRRLNMRRFPRSTIILMTVILIGVGLAIESARNIQLKYASGMNMRPVWDTFPGFFTFGFGLMFVAALSVWAILFALRRTGMHRLANVESWHDNQ